MALFADTAVLEMKRPSAMSAILEDDETSIVEGVDKSSFMLPRVPDVC